MAEPDRLLQAVRIKISGPRPGIEARKARYTASAPLNTAARSISSLPTGARISIFGIILPLFRRAHRAPIHASVFASRSAFCLACRRASCSRRHRFHAAAFHFPLSPCPQPALPWRHRQYNPGSGCAYSRRCRCSFCIHPDNPWRRTPPLGHRKVFVGVQQLGDILIQPFGQRGDILFGIRRCDRIGRAAMVTLTLLTIVSSLIITLSGVCGRVSCPGTRFCPRRDSRSLLIII